MTPAAASELHKNCVMLVVDDRIGASAGCAEVDGEVREWLREAAEAEVSAAALRVLWAMCLACDAACLPFGMVGELRRKLSPIALAVLLLFMGVGIMNIRVSAEFPCLRQRAAFCFGRRPEVPAAAFRVHWAMCLAYDAACLPFGMVGEPRRKLSPITILVLLLSMGVDLMDIRVSAEFPSSRQRAAFCVLPECMR